jgi:hypothetical protein
VEVDLAAVAFLRTSYRRAASALTYVSSALIYARVLWL